MNGPLIIHAPDDFHLHARQGGPLRDYLAASSAHFARVLLMPNVIPPPVSPESLERYRNEVRAALAGSGDASFQPLFSFKLQPGMDPEMIHSLKESGCIAAKLYPAGATTNSADGMREPDLSRELLRAIAGSGLILSVHAEDPEAPVFDRESAYIPVLERILDAEPGIRMVVEHVSLAKTLAWLDRCPSNVAGTITLHHLLFSVEDMLGEQMRPHLFCKPVLKGLDDREALRQAAFSGNARWFFGSDSAPHPVSKKEAVSVPGGIFSAPVAIPLLAKLFIDAGKAQALEAFTSKNGAAFYGLAQNDSFIEITESPWTVPVEIGGARPLLAGEGISLSVRKKPV